MHTTLLPAHMLSRCALLRLACCGAPGIAVQSTKVAGSVTLAVIKRLSVPVLVVNANSGHMADALKHHVVGLTRYHTLPCS